MGFGETLCGRVSTLRTNQFGQSEVENLHRTRSGNDDISRLDVAMNHSFRVSSRKRLGNLNPQPGDLITVQCPPEDVVLERSAVQVLHRDEPVALVLLAVVNRADIRMIK